MTRMVWSRGTEAQGQRREAEARKRIPGDRGEGRRLSRRRIGVNGNVRGSGTDGEHSEASMPENVRLLLEPYRRRII
jgi:hypothetical protein